MAETEVQRIVVAGGGAAGAATAAAAAISLRGSPLQIALIEAPADVAATGVVATRGGPDGFHQLLGIDEGLLMQRAGGAYGLGTRYRGFRADGEDAVVPLGSHGMTLRLVDFHHYIAKLRAAGESVSYNNYSLPAAAAAAGHFRPPGDPNDPIAKTAAYDINLDSHRYANLMREIATNLGVTMITADIAGVELDDAGAIGSVLLADGNRTAGDFFVDCTENNSVINELRPEIGGLSRWSACDRSLRLTQARSGAPDLMTTIDASDAGWLRSTDLADVTDCAFVYSGEDCDDETGRRLFAAQVGDAHAADAELAHYGAGELAARWVKNCVALGAAPNAIEPLVVSHLHLAQSSLLRLLAMLPRQRTNEVLAAEFNRVARAELESVRDYHLLHYVLSGRRSAAFWARLDSIELPDTLQRRIALFQSHGRFTRRDHEFFSKAEWVSSFLNFGAWPASYDPLADMTDETRMRRDVERFRENVSRMASAGA